MVYFSRLCIVSSPFHSLRVVPHLCTLSPSSLHLASFQHFAFSLPSSEYDFTQASTFLNSQTPLPLSSASSLFLVSHFSPLSRSSIITLASLSLHPFLPFVYWLHQTPDSGNVRQRGRGDEGDANTVFLDCLDYGPSPISRVSLPEPHSYALTSVSSNPPRHSSAASFFSFPSAFPHPSRARPRVLVCKTYLLCILMSFSRPSYIWMTLVSVFPPHASWLRRRRSTTRRGAKEGSTGACFALSCLSRVEAAARQSTRGGRYLKLAAKTTRMES